MTGGCWGCRVAMWAIALIIIGLTAKALAGAAVVAALATKAGVSVGAMTGMLQGLFGLSVGAATDTICCRVFGVCCPRVRG